MAGLLDFNWVFGDGVGVAVAVGVWGVRGCDPGDGRRITSKSGGTSEERGYTGKVGEWDSWDSWENWSVSGPQEASMGGYGFLWKEPGRWC